MKIKGLKLIPELKIGGRKFSIEYIKGLADNGSTDFDNNIILIKDNMSVDNKLSTVLHELLEVINETYDLNLSHQTIQTLEAGLFQVIKDNKL